MTTDTKSEHLESKVDSLFYRVKWYIQIRWVILGAIAIPNLLLRWLVESPYTPIKQNLYIAIAIGGCNGLFWWLSRGNKSANFLKQFALAQVIADLLFITALIFTNGGINSHSPILYCFPILASGVVYYGPAMIRVALAAVFLYTLTALSLYYELLHSPTPYSTNYDANYDANAFFNLLIFINSTLLIVAIIGNFFVKLIGRNLVGLEEERSKNREAAGQIADEAVNFQVRTKALFDSIGEGLIVVNEYGNIDNVNKSALDILGFREEQLLKKWFPKAIISLDDNGGPVPTARRAIVQALETGKPVSTQSQFVSSQGENIPVYQTAAPFIVDGVPAGGVVVFRDITAERELQKAKDDFVSLASHQLRTPASAVKNFIGLLKEGYAGKLTKEQSSYVDSAYESNERQLAIVNDLLHVARTESGQLKLKRQDYDLIALVNEVVQEQMPVITERQQVIRVNSPKKSLTANFDQEYFRMVVENLITNASKYTPAKGKITVDITNTPRETSVAVTDTGVGIAKADQAKLFKKFSRIDNKLSSNVQGSGIGLYLLKKIMDLHKGKVEVKSNLGKGSVFTVKLSKIKQGEQPNG